MVKIVDDTTGQVIRDTANDYTVSVGGVDYHVIDGDTIRNKETGESIRVKGLQAPETFHGTYVDNEQYGYTAPHVGGQHSRDILYNILNRGDFDALQDEKTQSVGRGSGSRTEADIINSKTGEDITSFLVREGLAEPTSWSSHDDRNAYELGELWRAVNGGSDDLMVEALRNNVPVNRNGFKAESLYASELRQLNSKQKKRAIEEGRVLPWFDPSEVFYGSEVRYEGEGEQGQALNPLSTRWSKAWSGAKADLGAAINALGFATDWESAKIYGQTVADINKDKAQDAPWLKINNIEDINDYSNDTFDYITNTLTWAGGHAVSSIPYLGAIAAGSAVAAPLVGVAAGAAGLGAGATAAATLAASTLPSALLHAGGIWNSVDESRKNASTAGVAFAAGTAAGLIDRLGFHGIIKPTEILSKGGKEKLLSNIMKVRGVDKNTATAILNKNYRAEAKHFLTSARNATVKDIADQQKFVNAAKNVLLSAGSEGLTEGLQEATQYLTYRSINNNPATATELLAFLQEESTNKDLWSNVIEGVAAGGAIGAGLSSVGTANEFRQNYGRRAKLRTGNVGNLAEIPKAFIDNATDGTVASIGQQAEQTFKQDPSRYRGTQAKRTEAGRKNTVYQQWKRNEVGTLDALGNYTQRFWIEPMRKAQNFTKALQDSAAVRQLYSTVSGIRGTYAGLSTERSTQRIVGQFRTNQNLTGIATRHGISHERVRDVRELGEKLLRFAHKTEGKGKNGRKAKLSDADLAEIGITREEVPLFHRTANEQRNAARYQYEKKLEAITEVYGVSSPEYKQFAKHRSDWWFTHRTIDPEKVRKNKSEFVDFITSAFNKDKSNLTADEKRLGARKYAEDLYETIANGAELTDYTRVGEDAASLINRSRVLDLANKEGFNAFAEDNFFAGHDRTLNKVATEISHLRSYGDKGSKLDVYFAQAEEQLRAAGWKEQDINNLLDVVAANTQDTIDASTGNYNAIKNQTVRKLTNGLLSYTAFLGLPFAVLASIPEFAVAMLKFASDTQGQKYAGVLLSHLFKEGFQRSLKNIGTTAVARNVLKVKAKPRVDHQYFDLMQRIGVPVDQSNITRRIGGEATGISDFMRNALNTFFFLNGLQGLTELQRGVLVPTGLDIIRDHSELLMDAVGPDGVIDTKGWTEQQITALQTLSQMGIDVPKLISLQHEMESAGVDSNSLQQTLLNGGEKSFDATGQAWQEQVETGLAEYINSTIQDPNSANRPLWVQDPRFRMFTQFNSFIAASHNTVIPNMWNDGVGRALRANVPGLTFQAFSVFMLMVALGGASQWLRDYIKHGETSPYLSDDPVRLVQRALFSSGTIGQFEKVVDVAHPLYEQRGSSTVGNIASAALGPAGRQGELVADIFAPNEKGNSAESFWKNIFKFVPVVSALPELRNDIATDIAGTNRG